MKKIIVILLLTLFAAASWAANVELGIKSAVLPGMGQISAGSGSIKSINTLKGLGFLTGFALSFHGFLSQVSQKESYAEQTQFYDAQEKKIAVGGNYSDLMAARKAHQEASDNYESANTLSFVCLGLSVAIYAYGVVDAMLFTQEDKKEEGASIKPSKVNLGLLQHNGQTGLAVQYHF